MGTYDVLDIVTMLPILFFPTPNNTFFILKSYPSFGRSNFIIWIQQHSLFEALLKRLTHLSPFLPAAWGIVHPAQASFRTK